MRTTLDFNSLDEVEKNIYLEDTWCSKCSEADLGIFDPQLYTENGKKFISGKCCVCREETVSEILIQEVKE